MDPSDLDSILNTRITTNYCNPNIIYNSDPVPNLGNVHTPILVVYQAIPRILKIMKLSLPYYPLVQESPLASLGPILPDSHLFMHV